MKNSFRRVLACVTLVLLCGCGRGERAADIRYYRLASGQSANHLANQACQQFCTLVEKKSSGMIQIIPSFENELGTDASAIEQCTYGGIDFVRTPLSAAASYAPLLTALQLPYEYTSDEHLFRVLDGAVGDDVMDSLEKQGLTGLSYFYAGYRCFFTTDKAITSLDDMAGLRLGTEDYSQMQLVIPQWGAVAVTLPPDETALALRTGRIDGAESTLPTYVDSGYYLLAPYWTYDRHSYNADVLVASSATWTEFTPEEQQMLMQCASEAAAWQRAHWQSAEVRAMLRASRSGCYMALLSEEETERFRNAASPLYEHLSEQQKEVVRRVGTLADEDT